jgi:hypothetical protein
MQISWTGSAKKDYGPINFKKTANKAVFFVYGIKKTPVGLQAEKRGILWKINHNISIPKILLFIQSY